VFIDIKKTHNATLIGLCKYQNDQYYLMKNPPNDLPIEINDYLILITNGIVKKGIEQLFGVKEGRLIHKLQKNVP
jgi:hypothetical protein